MLSCSQPVADQAVARWLARSRCYQSRSRCTSADCCACVAPAPLSEEPWGPLLASSCHIGSALPCSPHPSEAPSGLANLPDRRGLDLCLPYYYYCYYYSICAYPQAAGPIVPARRFRGASRLELSCGAQRGGGRVGDGSMHHGARRPQDWHVLSRDENGPADCLKLSSGARDDAP